MIYKSEAEYLFLCHISFTNKRSTIVNWVIKRCFVRDESFPLINEFPLFCSKCLKSYMFLFFIFVFATSNENALTVHHIFWLYSETFWYDITLWNLGISHITSNREMLLMVSKVACLLLLLKFYCTFFIFHELYSETKYYWSVWPQTHHDLNNKNNNLSFEGLDIHYQQYHSSSNHTQWEGLSWSWSYGSWIYNYLCIQCLSQLKLWVWTSFMARCTRYNIMW